MSAKYIFKWLSRVSLFTIFNIGLVWFFYITPGFSQNVFVTLYNIFALLVLFGTIFLYSHATKDAYEICELNETKKTPNANKKWLSLWNEYQSTINNETGKTDQLADIYFNSEEMTEYTIKRFPVLPILKAMPATYTGLGILGTFMGFSAGLSGFDTTSTQTMQDSIRSLLAGINTAFNTSIVGVALSIIFNFIFLHPLLKNLDKETRVLSNRLDSEHYSSLIDQIKEIFVFKDDNGNSIHPRSFFNSIHKELQKQTVSLASFTTDLSDSIVNLTNSLTEAYKIEMSSLIENKIEPVLKSLLEISEKLKEQKEESISDTISGIVEKLDQALTAFIHQLKDEIAGATNNELNATAEQLKIASDALGLLPNLISQIEDSFTTIIDIGTNRIDVSFNEIFKNINESTNVIEKTISSVKDMQIEIDSTLGNFKTISANTERSIIMINNTSENLNSTAKLFSQDYQNLAELLEIQKQDINNIIEKIKKTTDEYDKVDESLALIFANIQNGIKEYSETVSISLSKQLSKYTDSISGFASKLAGAAEALEDSINTLSMQMENNKPEYK